MARSKRGTRDGTGPYKESYRRGSGRSIGRRGGVCRTGMGADENPQELFAGLNKTVLGALAVGIGVWYFFLRR